jgi:hypothetical protein
MPVSQYSSADVCKKNAVIKHKKIAASVIIMSITALPIFFGQSKVLRLMHMSILSGEAWIQELLAGHP